MTPAVSVVAMRPTGNDTLNRQPSDARIPEVKEDHADRVDVGAAVDGLAASLFRRHVRRGADD
jgi:hypothetical protein